MASFMERLDDGVAKVERFVILVFLAVMSLVVFFDVVFRNWTAPQGVLVKLMSSLSGRPLDDPMLGTLDEPLAAVLLFVFVFAALRSAATEGRFGTAGGAAIGAVLTVIATGIALKVLIWVFPNGLVWSQPLALALLLWVALIGASLATKAKAHIVLEVADKIWPASVHPYVKLFSGLGAGAFSLLVLALGVHFASDFWDQWRQFDTQRVQGTPIPIWTVYGAIPVSFATMGTRFIGYAIRDFRHRGDDPHANEAEVAS